MSNFWDELMATDEGAATYMDSYGEGPGCETRRVIGSFINEAEKVLDVGCGPGWNFDHFRKYGPRVSYLGEDYSERFVRVARERFEKNYPRSRQAKGLKQRYGRTPFRVGDCRKLAHPDRSRDVVILQDVLEHTNGYEQPVWEALRVAKKRVIITFWRTFNENGQHDINDDGNDGYGATYDRGKWEEFLNSLGYRWTTTETSPEANRWHKYYIIYKETA